MTHEQRVTLAILNFQTSPNLADPVEVGKRLAFDQVADWLDYGLFAEVTAKIQNKLEDLAVLPSSPQRFGHVWAYRVCLAMLTPLGD